MKQTKRISLMGLFLGIMVISAYLQITLPTPFFVMHITLQIFVCIVCGLCFPLKQVTMIMAVYILIGLCGLPVFASGGGIYYVMKPTFGFVLGFLFTGMFCSYLASKRKMETYEDYRKIGLAGLAVFYLSGNLYYYVCTHYVLHTMVPLQVCLFNCFVVSIVPDVFLCLVASRCAKRLKPYIKA